MYKRFNKMSRKFFIYPVMGLCFFSPFSEASSELAEKSLLRKMENDQYLSSIQRASELRAKMLALKGHMERLAGVSDSEFIKYAIINMWGEAYVEPVKKLHNEYSAKLREKELLEVQGVGPKHPRMLVVDETIKKLEADLSDEVKAARGKLNDKLKALTVELEMAEEAVEKMKTANMDREMSRQEYKAALNSYNEELEVLKRIGIEWDTEKLRLKVLRESSPHDGKALSEIEGKIRVLKKMYSEQKKEVDEAQKVLQRHIIKGNYH